MAKTLIPTEVESYRQNIRKLSNRARFKEAYALSRQLKERYPHVLLFAYYEAVMSAEDDTGYTTAKLRARHKAAARKLKPKSSDNPAGLLQRVGLPAKF